MASTLYVDRPSPIHRLNPVTKLVILVTVIVVVFAIPFWWVAAGVVVVVIVPAAVVSGCGGRLARLGLTILLPLVVVLFVVQGLTFPGGRTALWEWGPLALTTEGLMFALGIGSRIVCLVLASILFVLTTHPGDLLTALTERGMSPKFSYIISSTLQLIPAFRDRADGILLAQQARGLAVGKGVRGRVGAMMPLLAPSCWGCSPMWRSVPPRWRRADSGRPRAARRSLPYPTRRLSASCAGRCPWSPWRRSSYPL